MAVGFVLLEGLVVLGFIAGKQGFGWCDRLSKPKSARSRR